MNLIGKEAICTICEFKTANMGELGAAMREKGRGKYSANLSFV
jgi:hypothetical protein